MSSPVGERIRELRIQRGWTMAELAQFALGSKKRSPEVYNWETGKHLPSTRGLERLANALETSVSNLLDIASHNPDSKVSTKPDVLAPTAQLLRELVPLLSAAGHVKAARAASIQAALLSSE